MVADKVPLIPHSWWLLRLLTIMLLRRRLAAISKLIAFKVTVSFAMIPHVVAFMFAFAAFAFTLLRVTSAASLPWRRKLTSGHPHWRRRRRRRRLVLLLLELRLRRRKRRRRNGLLQLQRFGGKGTDRPFAWCFLLLLLLLSDNSGLGRQRCDHGRQGCICRPTGAQTVLDVPSSLRCGPVLQHLLLL